MSIFAGLDKKNLHHAYLIEGDKDKVLPEVLKFVEGLGVKTSGNADFSLVSADSFKIEDARSLKAMSAEKGSAMGLRVFVISANSFLLEAQNTLLKMFEEPIENTIFFLIVPDKNSLLKTLVSRFYLVGARRGLAPESDQAEKFIKLPVSSRIDFLKELLQEEEGEEEETYGLDSSRSKALKFLNSLESTLHKQIFLRAPLKNQNLSIFEHFFKVRKYLRMPGSSAKSLMESVALNIPNLSK